MSSEYDSDDPEAMEAGEDLVEKEPAHLRIWWAASTALSVILVLGLAALWYGESQSQPEDIQLADPATVDAFLAGNWQHYDSSNSAAVPTGVFVQSLEFLSTTNVHMSGYIWQQRMDGIHDAVSEGFILPDQVDSTVEPREEYRIRNGDQQVIGWYFEGVFRQGFDFSDYPFDHKYVSLTVWPKDFDGTVVLVPDFAAYPCPAEPEASCTGRDDVFGINEAIVLGEFDREHTYFDYELSSYNSNFGIESYDGQVGYPELRYNLVLGRHVQDAFTIYVVPLFVVAALAYMTLLLATRSTSASSRFGFNTFQSLAVLAALFFVLTLSQSEIRSEFPGSGFVYIEWFYFVMYVVLLWVAINAYMVTSPRQTEWRVVRYGDNLIAKVTYWPLVLGSLFVITVLSL